MNTLRMVDIMLPLLLLGIINYRHSAVFLDPLIKHHRVKPIEPVEFDHRNSPLAHHFIESIQRDLQIDHSLLHCEEP